MAERLDKADLVQSGKGFGRVFVDYLLFESDLVRTAGVITPALLSVINDERKALSDAGSRIYARQVMGWQSGEYKMPQWASQVVMGAAVKHGFVIRHVADCLAVSITLNHRLGSSVSDFKMMMTIMQDQLNLSVPGHLYVPMCQVWGLYNQKE